MKKFIIIFIILLIPFNVKAWDELSVYNAFDTGNDNIITNCGASGNFNWNKVGTSVSGSTPWSIGYLGGTGNNVIDISTAFKYDLPAQKTYEVQFNTTGTITSYLNVNSVYIYSGTTCGNTWTGGDISLIGFSKDTNYIRLRIYTNSIISNWRIKFSGGSNYIISGSWSLTGVYLREIDTTGTNEIITNNTQNTQTIVNNNNQNTQKIVNAVTSDDIPTDNGDYFDDFNDMLPSNNTISSLITLPLSLYTKVLNSINGTCSAISLGSLYNHNLVMPCIDLSQYLGNTLWSTLDLIISGVFVLVISKKMVKAFHSFTSLKEGDVINND